MGFGLTTAAVWVAGALWTGPPPMWRTGASRSPGPLLAGLIGILAFAVFASTAIAAKHLQVLEAALRSLFRKADAGPVAVILLVALANAVGEELFFRGALHASGTPRTALVTTVVYAGVTLATGNAALVLAAVVMGIVWAFERVASGTVLSPLVTHVVWSTLMIVALPR